MLPATGIFSRSLVRRPDMEIALSFSIILVLQIRQMECANMNPIDFNGLDPAVHGPIQLGIMTAMQVDGALDFTTLKKRLDTVGGT